MLLLPGIAARAPIAHAEKHQRLPAGGMEAHEVLEQGEAARQSRRVDPQVVVQERLHEAHPFAVDPSGDMLDALHPFIMRPLDLARSRSEKGNERDRLPWLLPARR